MNENKLLHQYMQKYFSQLKIKQEGLFIEFDDKIFNALIDRIEVL